LTAYLDIPPRIQVVPELGGLEGALKAHRKLAADTPPRITCPRLLRRSNRAAQAQGVPSYATEAPAPCHSLSMALPNQEFSRFELAIEFRITLPCPRQLVSTKAVPQSGQPCPDFQ
jgi:hypothetical protein